MRAVPMIHGKHQRQLAQLPAEQQRHTRLCELNVIEQVVNVCHTTVVREAWARGHEVAVHGWIYGLGDGLLRDLGMGVTSEADLRARYELACTGTSLA